MRGSLDDDALAIGLADFGEFTGDFAHAATVSPTLTDTPKNDNGTARNAKGDTLATSVSSLPCPIRRRFSR
jgi:hypothetical protein